MTSRLPPSSSPVSPAAGLAGAAAHLRRRAAPASKRPHKYAAKSVVIDGIRFASTKEGTRYQELKLLFRAREISELQLQPKFGININGQQICWYTADFRYFSHGKEIVEDVKGVRTPVYKLKKRLVEAVYGIKITEV